MLADHQGTIRQIADNSGTLLNQIDYDSYGNITGQSNPSVTFRFGYTGREWDGETGQYYYRARYYDPQVGQFISQDPIGFSAGDANLYRYVGNSPTNYIDPTGLFKVEIRYRATLGSVPILNRVAHADIVVTDSYGSRAYWMTPIQRGSCLKLEYQEDLVYGSISDLYQGNPDFIQVVYDDGSTKQNIELELKIVNSLKRMHKLKTGYNLLANNSNSGAFQALRDAGIGINLKPRSGILAPGWEENPHTNNERALTAAREFSRYLQNQQ
jgi:RHS repeat-associated protein